MACQLPFGMFSVCAKEDKVVSDTELRKPGFHTALYRTQPGGRDPGQSEKTVGASLGHGGVGFGKKFCEMLKE